jgi:hypothetical protein
MNVSDHSSISQLPTVSVPRQPQPQPPSSLSQQLQFQNEVAIAEKLQLPASSLYDVAGFHADMLHTPQSELEQQFDALAGSLACTPAIFRCGGLGRIQNIEFISQDQIVIHERGGNSTTINEGASLLSSLEKLQAMATILVQRRPPSNETTAPQPQPSQSLVQPVPQTSFASAAQQLVQRPNTTVTTLTTSASSSSVDNTQATSSQHLLPPTTSAVSQSDAATGTATLQDVIEPKSIPEMSRRIKSAAKKQDPESSMPAVSQIKVQELLTLGEKLGVIQQNKGQLTKSIKAILGRAHVNTESAVSIDDLPQGYAINEYIVQLLDGTNEKVWATTRNTGALPLIIDLRVCGNRSESGLVILKKEMLNAAKQSSARVTFNANKAASDGTRGA